MNSTIKSLIAKSWKNETADLEAGRHHFDEEFVVRVHGSVEKHDDQLVTPTVSIPLISVLALFWEKAGIARDEALSLLREATTEAMAEGVNEDRHIKNRIKDVNTAITAVRWQCVHQRVTAVKQGGSRTGNRPASFRLWGDQLER